MKTKKFIRSNPHLPVSDLRKTIEYYRDTLGFYDEWVWTDKDGELTDGGIRRDDIRLLFGEDSDFRNVMNCYDKGSLPLMWFVDNIEAMFSEFKERNIQLPDTLRK